MDRSKLARSVRRLLTLLWIVKKQEPKTVAIDNTMVTAAGATFERVWGRLTASEFRRWVNANGGAVSAPTDDEMTAECACTLWAWNGGVGTLNGSNKYSATGMIATYERADELKALAETTFVADAAAFINACTNNDNARARALIAADESTPSFEPRNTRIVLWDLSDYNTALAAYPNLNANGNFVLPLDIFWGYGTGTAATIDTEAVAEALAAKPAGRRYLKMGDYNLGGSGVEPSREPDYGGFFGVYSPTTERMCIFDREFDTPARKGLSMETWWSTVNAAGSNHRQFFEDLLAYGREYYGDGNERQILDGVVLDVERFRNLWQWQRGVDSWAAEAVESIDTTSDEITITAHGWITGEPVVWSNSGGALPALASGSISTTKPYFVQRINDDTIKVHTSPAGAVADTGALNFSGAGTGTHTLTAKGDTLDNIIYADASEYWDDWIANRIKPTLSAAVWATASLHDAGGGWNTASDHRAFLFDAWFNDYYSAKIAGFVGIIQEYFPAVNVHEYNGAHAARGTYSYAFPQLKHAEPFGAGNPAGGHSINLYGDFYASRWDWPNDTTQSFSGSAAEKKWASFATMLEKWRGVRLATFGDVLPWVTYENYLTSSYSQYGADGLWHELIFHVALGSPEINFYNDNATAAQHLLFCNLIAEVDRVAKYQPGLHSYADPIATYLPAYMATRVWCGNRWVWRVTPNNTLAAATWARDADGTVTFTFGDASTLEIEQANVHAGTSLGTLGYWVEEDASQVNAGGAAFTRTAARVLGVKNRGDGLAFRR